MENEEKGESRDCFGVSLNFVLSFALHDFYVENFYILLGLLFVRPSVLNPMDDVQPLYGSTKNCMLIVEPWLLKFSLRLFMIRMTEDSPSFLL